MRCYEMEGKATFMLHGMLACAAQYAPLDLLKSCNFQNRVSAQRAFFERATLLYDLGYERSQLRLLQGSVILGTVAFSMPLDKDFRYWLQNAARIAVNMGLHQESVRQTSLPLPFLLHEYIKALAVSSTSPRIDADVCFGLRVMTDYIDRKTQKLCRRIWWSLYVRL